MTAIAPPKRRPTRDLATDLALQELVTTVKQLTEQPFAQARVIEAQALADGATVAIRHGLGRRYKSVFVSPVRGPAASGRIEELTPTDAAAEVWLKATGFGATVTVDLVVL